MSGPRDRIDIERDLALDRAGDNSLTSMQPAFIEAARNRLAGDVGPLLQRLDLLGRANDEQVRIIQALRSRLDQAEAVIDRVRAVVDSASPFGPNYDAIRAALAGVAARPEPEQPSEVDAETNDCPYASVGGQVFLDNLRRLRVSERTRAAVAAACACGSCAAQLDQR